MKKKKIKNQMKKINIPGTMDISKMNTENSVIMADLTIIFVQ